MAALAASSLRLSVPLGFPPLAVGGRKVHQLSVTLRLCGYRTVVERILNGEALGGGTF